MGPILSRSETSKVVERSGNALVSAASCAVNGFRVSMEDAHCMILPNSPDASGRYVFGVFDGHSNETCSIFIAKELPPLLLKLDKDATDAQIEQAFIDADAKYIAEDRGGGSTGTVAILDAAGPTGPVQLTVCNTGDSRVIVIRKGELLFVTNDHKPADPAERARIEAADGMVRMNRVDGELAVSRAFGDSMFKRTRQNPRETKVVAVPDVTRIPLEKGDVVMLACDGVFEGNFTTEQVVEFTQRLLSCQPSTRPEPFAAAKVPYDLAVAAALVCDQAIRRGSKDNISCMLVRVGDNGAEAVNAFGAHSYVPGPPPLRNNTNSRNAFEKMAKMAGVTVGKALERRYQLVKSRQGLAPPNFSELEAHAFDLQDPLDMDGEERYFGQGPPSDCTNVEKWFDELTSS